MGSEHVDGGGHAGRDRGLSDGSEFIQSASSVGKDCLAWSHASRAMDSHASHRAPMIKRPEAFALDELVDQDVVEALADLIDEGDFLGGSDGPMERAPCHRSVVRDEPELGQKWRGQSALGGRVGASTRAGGLARRMEELRREAELERRGRRSRLDWLALPTDDDAFGDRLRKLKRKLALRAPGLDMSSRSCVSCGSPAVEFPSSLCRRCREAEMDAHAWALGSERSPMLGNRALDEGADEPCAMEESLSMDSESEIEARRKVGAEEGTQPGQSEHLRSREGVTGRQFCLWLALLSIGMGIALVLYGLDRVSTPSTKEARHAGA